MKKAVIKIINIISICFTLFILIFTIISINVNKDYGNGLFGYKCFIVMSDSMKPEFQVGDIVIIKSRDTQSLKEGDIITYYVGDGTVLTHQIIEKLDGKYITKGINVSQVDKYPVYPSKIIGKYLFTIPLAGDLILTLKTPTGYILFILLPLLFIMILSGSQFIKNYNQFKKERNNEILKKKLILDQEIEKCQKLQEELKQQIEQLLYLQLIEVDQKYTSL